MKKLPLSNSKMIKKNWISFEVYFLKVAMKNWSKKKRILKLWSKNYECDIKLKFSDAVFQNHHRSRKRLKQRKHVHRNIALKFDWVFEYKRPTNFHLPFLSKTGTYNLFFATKNNKARHLNNNVLNKQRWYW